jgi:hypothetical protein
MDDNFEVGMQIFGGRLAFEFTIIKETTLIIYNSSY